MTIGIMGLGRLGSALARGLEASGKHEVMYGYNRGKAKAEELQSRLSRLRLCGTESEILERCDLVFLWIKKSDAEAVLSENAALVRSRQPLVVTCTLGVEVGAYTPRWAECHPNVNMPTRRGVTILRYGPELGEEDRELLASVLGEVGTVYEASAEDLTFYSGLSSCGPALYATIMELVADSMSARRGFDRELCRALVRETAEGTIRLQEEDRIDAAEVVRRVAHPGGSSEGGVRVLKELLPGVLEEMFRAMKKW